MEAKMGQEIKPIKETEHLIHTIPGALNFVGGAFDTEKVKRVEFVEIIDIALRNGIQINIGLGVDSERIFKMNPHDTARGS